MTDSRASGPTPDEITTWITTTWPETVVAQAMGATFFSLTEQHWPNFATIVTTDEHDMGAPSNLTARSDVFRLNIGVGKATFDRLVGHAGADAGSPAPDFSAIGRILPHPVYTKQRWLAILNPSRRTYDEQVKTLLEEAHARLARPRRNASSTNG
jgi:hypothetical protein